MAVHLTMKRTTRPCSFLEVDLVRSLWQMMTHRNNSVTSRLHMVGNDLRPTIANDSELEDNPPVLKFLSPHDDVLARMHGEPSLVGNEDVSLRDRDTQTADHSSPAGSYSTTNNLPGNHKKEVLYDPFDGTPLGLLVPTTSQDHLQNRPDSKKRGTESENKEQWVHLSRVLDLQSEIAKMHLDMEGIGSSDGKGKGAVKGRQAKTRVLGDHERERRDRDEVSGMQTARDDTTDEDEEGVDTAGDPENESKRARETEFANLAKHFAQRNEAVGEIMDKVCDFAH